MRYQCADCGQWSDTPFPDVYQHWAAGMVIMRCADCAEEWAREVAPLLDKVNANGRSRRKYANAGGFDCGGNDPTCPIHGGTVV